MNGLILNASTENKYIKFINKKCKDTLEDLDGEIFEKLVTTLISNEKESKNGEFLLAKLLNIPTEFEKNGKILSQFSKDDLKSLLENTNSTENNTFSFADNTEQQEKDELLIGELFTIALGFKNDSIPEKIDTLPKVLQEKLTDKNVIQSLKSATSLKELLSIAEKNGIKIKNFEFFQEKRALTPSDQKLVQKITSANLFQQTDKVSKEVHHNTHQYTTEHRPAKQNILSKIIKKSTKNSKQISSKEVETPTILKQKKETVQISTADTKTNSDSQTMLDFELQDIDTQTSQKSTRSIKQHHTPTQGKKNQPLAQLIETIDRIDSKPKEEQPVQNNQEKVHAVEQSEHPLTRDTIKTEAPSKVKEPIEAKRSLNTFAQEFKEQVDSYKSPLMKVKMQLTPQHLGDVDVTLLNRGSTLHVNITSNHNAMAIFMQNQAEFKNSLVNMGFSDLQMNFSQSDQGRNRQGEHQKRGQNDSFEAFDNEEFTDSIDITLPNYV